MQLRAVLDDSSMEDILQAWQLPVAVKRPILTGA